MYQTWVCLANTDDDSAPDSTERMKLKLVGLGEKRFVMDTKVTAQGLIHELEYQFPKLKDSGGIELLRSDENHQRDLEVIEMPAGGYTCEYLRAIVSNAKLYIRPIQINLSMDPSNDVSQNDVN